MNVALNREVVSKGRFAALKNVTPGRVSQWIAEGKIKRDALVGEGRNAQIDVEIATLQLRNSLDINQRAGNGLDTRLDLPLPAPAPPDSRMPIDAAPPSPPPVPAAVDRFEEQIKQERLDQLRRSNRKAAEEEAARAGRYTDAAEAARRMGVIASQMMTVIDGSLTEIATAVSARFEIPQRDVLHLLRAEFRKVRSNGAKMFRDQAEAVPAMIEAEFIEADSD